MRETEKRIRMYQAQLPFLKERVLASLLIFAFAIAMVTMTTFAWNTLSVAPEVSGSKTVITANGNLEIALAGNYDIKYLQNKDGSYVYEKDANGNIVYETDENGNPVYEKDKAGEFVLDENGEKIPVPKRVIEAIIPTPPSASAVGDSLLSIQQRNTTWGNLINLSDPSYGLDKIVLRPTTLNTGMSLAKKPFVSAKYGPDGRVEHTNDSDFAYTQYLQIADNEYGFLKSDLPGVKAVSSVLEQPTHVDSKLGLYYDKMTTNVIPVTIFDTARKNLYRIVASMDMASGAEYSPLSGLMGVYLNGVLYNNLTETAPSGWEAPSGWSEYKPAVCDRKDIETMRDVMQKLETDVLNIIGEGYVEIFYLYQMDTYINREEYDKMADPEGTDDNPDTPKFEWPSGWKRYAEDEETGYVTKEGIEEFLATAPGLIDAMIAERAKVEGDTTKEADKKVLLDFKAKINAYKTLRQDLLSALTTIQTELEEGNEICWYEVQGAVNKLVNIQTTQINGETLSGLFSSLSDNATKLQTMLKNPAEKNTAVVYDGIIRDIDAMLFTSEGGIQIKKVSVVAEEAAIQHRIRKQSSFVQSIINAALGSGDKTIFANIKTNAPTKDANGQWNPCVTSEVLLGTTSVLDKGYVIYSYQAMDTYGLAIDFWLRTNVPGASLILEGKVEFEDRPITKELTGGTTVTLYLADIKQTITEEGKDPEILEITSTVYFLKETDEETGTEQTVWYYEENNTPVVTDTTEIVGTPQVKTEKVAVGYSAANRIWKEDDFPVGIDPQYSTTQGSGSCYTFYADPTELNTILGVLERMRVAFIDSNGNLLAMAKLDTKYCFSEYGRHLVPLVIYNGGETTVTDALTGVETTYSTIMNMQTNTATMLSALIYLEGTAIENKDVLASANIQGQFNIQFGTVYDEKALKDETLMKESITLSAELTGESDNGTEYTKTVTATITGLKSTKDENGEEVWPPVQANFTRKISATQGSLYFAEPQTFTYIGNNKWTCDFTFNTPGDYVLRSLTIDGQERLLPGDEKSGWITFTIEGFKINNLFSAHGQKFSFMTADSYVSDQFTLEIEASGAFADQMPKIVKGIFTNEDNVNVDLNFTSQEKEGKVIWTANVNFNASGTYTLRYLLLDGEYYELPNPFIREVILGLQTKVWLTAPKNFKTEEDYKYDTAKDVHSFFYYPDIEEAHEFAAVVEIYDESGKEIRQLGGSTGVKLVYGDISTYLKWNAADDNYSGAGLTPDIPNVYSFSRVEITTDQWVTATLGAPTIRIQTKDPYNYTGVNTAGATDNVFNAILAPNPDNASAPRVEVHFENAASASVYGLFKITNPAGEVSYEVLPATKTDNAEGTGQTFVFYISELETVSTYTDGFYQLMGVKLTNVTGSDKKFYQSEDGLTTKEEFENADSTKFLTPEHNFEADNLTIKVIKNVYVSDNMDDKNSVYGLGEDGKTPVGLFMQSNSIKDIKFTVVDFAGEAIPSVAVNVTYTRLASKSKTYGGYTFEGWDKAASSVDLTGKQFIVTTSTDGKEFTVNNFDLTTAGEYQLYATVMIGDKIVNNYTADVIKIWSAKPTATITGISPSGTNPAKLTYKEETTRIPFVGTVVSNVTFSTNGDATSSFDSETNTAILYALAKVDNSSLQHRGNFTLPTLKITVSGMGKADKATLEIPSTNTHVSKLTYQYTKDGEQSNSLGTQSVIKEWKIAGYGHELYAYYGYGEVSITQMQLEKGSVKYTVTLDTPIKIKNYDS